MLNLSLGGSRKKPNFPIRLKSMKTPESSLVCRGLLTLALLSGSSFSHAGDIIRIDFDSFASTFTYPYAWAGYGSGGNVDVGAQVVSTMDTAPIGMGGTNALRHAADLSGISIPSVVDYTYWGCGLSMAAIPAAALPSPSLDRYRLSLDTMVAGLNSGLTQSIGSVTVLFYAPDGTIGTTDGNRDLVLQASYPVTHKSTLTTTSFPLTSPTGFGGGTAPATFASHYAAVNEIEVRPEITRGPENFSFDAGNELIVDNVVLVDEAPPAETPLLTLDYDNVFQSWGGTYFDYGDFGEPYTQINTSPVLRSAIQRTNGGVGDSGCRFDCVDTSAWAGSNNPVPPGAAYSSYLFGSTISYDSATQNRMAVSSRLEDYRLDFDIQATGFSTQPTGKVILVLEAPDDTISPPDADTNRDLILNIRFEGQAGFPIPNTFGKVSRMLSVGAISSGSLERFQQYHEKIQFFQFQFETNTTPAATGFDGDNCVSFDNLQLLSISPAQTPLRITAFTATKPDQISITFDSIAGRRYRVHQSTTLQGFSPIGVIDATGTSTTFLRTQTLLSSEFFKVEDLGTP